MSELAQQQQWLVRAIAAVAPVPPTPLGGAAVPAELGLHIYRHAYRARLEECLADDFPAVKSLLGDDAFVALAGRTISAHPPRHATLNRYGHALVQTLRRWSPQYGRHAVDLARLEWALCVALHAPLAAKLDPQALATLPPARLPQQCFKTAPSLQVIASPFPIASSYRLYLRDQPVAAALPDAQTVAVVRTAHGLERIDFSAKAGRILRRLQRGQSIAQALDGIALNPAEIQHAFAIMVAKGCLIAFADHA